VRKKKVQRGEKKVGQMPMKKEGEIPGGLEKKRETGNYR